MDGSSTWVVSDEDLTDWVAEEERQMAVQTPGRFRSGYQAEVDMSGAGFQYRLLKLGSAAGLMNRCAATTDIVVGVLQNRPKLNRSVSYAADGVLKVEAGGAINRGDWCYTDSSGRAVADNVSGHRTIGQARSAVSGAGILVEIEFERDTLVP